MAGRRWGPGVSGWLVGFPLTSGPVAFFLALDQGVSFAAGAAVGSMTGAAAQAVFCVLYGRWARGRHWAVALLAGALGFAAASVALQRVTLALVPLLALVIGAIVVALVFMPRDFKSARPGRRPRWDIPARFVVTTAIVLLLTGLATVLGPSLTAPRGIRPSPRGPRPRPARASRAPARTLRVCRVLLRPGAVDRAHRHRPGFCGGQRGGDDPAGRGALGDSPPGAG